MIKRTMDVVLSLIALLILWPALVCIAGACLYQQGAPVFFRQTRAGKNGKPFRLLKFRTMDNGRDSAGQLLPDDQRITRIGQFLRSTSMDELPEIYNILRGEMSWVGPRPLPVKYLNRYSSEQARRHDVRPGLTGLAQVNGRNATSWSERFDHDIRYVRSQSVRLDIQILLKTVSMVLRREGISQDGEATMSEFSGSDAQPPNKS